MNLRDMTDYGTELNDGEQKPKEEPKEEPKVEPKQQQEHIATADAVKEEKQEQKEPSQSPRDDEDVTTKEVGAVLLLQVINCRLTTFVLTDEHRKTKETNQLLKPPPA